MLRKTLQECKSYPDPLAAPDYTEADVQALKALQRGSATADQQQRAIAFIINTVCGTYDCASRRNERETNLALGKQRAGQHLVYFLNDAPTETPIAKIASRLMGTKQTD